MFYDKQDFAFVEVLERHWDRILAEYRAVRSALHDWHERHLYDQGWQVLGLYGFPDGKPLAPNLDRCPFTANLIQEHIPTHGAAGFSVLGPGTSIRPHCGYQGPFLRCHLGLIVPVGDCTLKVSEEVRPWKTGEALIFDDRVVHEAWNQTEHERVVLLIDFRSVASETRN